MPGPCPDGAAPIDDWLCPLRFDSRIASPAPRLPIIQSQWPPEKLRQRREEVMGYENRRSFRSIVTTRRRVLKGGVALLAQLPALGIATTRAAPEGAMTLAWHTAMAPRWLDPQEHDGTATPDNFLTALHDALIKNSSTDLYNHPALAERHELAEDGRSATFWLREDRKSTRLNSSHLGT